MPRARSAAEREPPGTYGGGSLPDGTGVIGLLLIKKGAGAGAYEHYHLGSGRASYGYQVNDAYAVHDQMLWLPIGLACAL